MKRYPIEIEVLWFGVNLCYMLWAVRIWRLDLVRVRPLLFAFLSVGFPMNSVSFAIRWFGPEEVWMYNSFWRWTQPFYWMLTLLVLVETYDHVFGRFRGFRTVAQLMIRVTTVGAGGLYLWMVFRGPLPQSWYHFWQAHSWGFFVAAAAFFFLIAAFAKLFQVPLSANDRLVIVVFGLMIGVTAVDMTLRKIWGLGVHTITTLVGPVVNLVTSIVGTWRFSREGEVPNSMRGEMSVVDATILEDLDAMRRVIDKTLRK